MDRWQLLRSKRLSIYVNRINTPDYDDLPHNHPWEVSYSLKLKGGYWEHVYMKASDVWGWQSAKANMLIPLRRRPPRWSRIPAVHRIVSLIDGKPCWTLFIGLKVNQDWGFVRPDGSVIPHQVRKAERGLQNED